MAAAMALSETPHSQKWGEKRESHCWQRDGRWERESEHREMHVEWHGDFNGMSIQSGLRKREGGVVGSFLHILQAGSQPPTIASRVAQFKC